MLSQSFFKMTIVISLMIAATYLYYVNKYNALDAGENWEVVGDFGNIKLVYAAPEYYPEQEKMAGILDTLIGEQFRQYRGMYNIYFFDDKEFTPKNLVLINRFNKGEEYPFDKEQFLHFRAKYHYAMPDESEFWYVHLTDTTVFPPAFQLYRAKIHPGYTGELRWGWEPGY